MGLIEYIVWSVVLLQFRGHAAKPRYGEYAVAYHSVRQTLPSENILKRVPKGLRAGMKRSFHENNSADLTLEIDKLLPQEGATITPWQEVPTGEAGRVYVGMSKPGLSADGRFAVLYVDWSAGPRADGEWWLLEKKNQRWLLRAKDRKMIS